MNAIPVVEAAQARPGPLGEFVAEFGALLDQTDVEAEILARGRILLGKLIRDDGWLPASHAAPGAERYQQYLLHSDPSHGFSVVSFVWGPGQATPVHDHTVWGLIGVLRGAELAERFAFDAEGALRSAGPARRLEVGTIDAVSPCVGDIHRVANAHEDKVSISIHVYGAEIGKVERATYDRHGRPKPFVSGYADLEPLF